MRYCCYLIIFFTLSLPILSSTVYSADFNIKLRKTDISELKQQLLPAFEQNIQVIKNLLSCLEKGQTADDCLEQLTIATDQNNLNKYKQQQEQIRLEFKKKRDEKNTREQIIRKLKHLLIRAEEVKLCLERGQSANALKDCIIQYRAEN